MILAIDIGNTTVSLAIVEDRRIKKIGMIATILPAASIRKSLKKILHEARGYLPGLDAVVVCSVVPKILRIIEPILVNARLRVLVIGRDIKVPIKNRYRKPSQVGQDRLVCANAAIRLYGAPVVVVDFGTAITFDVVSKNGEYLGGIIIPGLRLFVESLFEKTALLPKVIIRKPKEFIGRDTESSILSGIFFGYGALCDGMIDSISRKLKVRPSVVLTGGYASSMNAFIKKPYRMNESLIFDGILLAYKQSRNCC